MEVPHGSYPYDSRLFDVVLLSITSPFQWTRHRSAETRQIMAAQTFSEKVAIDGLSGRRPLPRRNDHWQLAGVTQPAAYRPGTVVRISSSTINCPSSSSAAPSPSARRRMKHIAPSGEHRLDLAGGSPFEPHACEAPVTMCQFLYPLRHVRDTAYSANEACHTRSHAGPFPSVTMVTEGEKANMARAYRAASLRRP